MNPHTGNSARYDDAVEQMLVALASHPEGLDTEGVEHMLGEHGIRAINARLHAAFETLVSEHAVESRAIERTGPAKSRRWYAGDGCEQALGALGRTRWRKLAQDADYVRIADEPAPEPARYAIELRTMRMCWKLAQFTGGVKQLRTEIDTMKIGKSAVELRSEVHIHKLLDREGDLFETAPPTGWGSAGERVRGMEDPHPQRTTWSGENDQPIVAEIVEGTWITRRIETDGEPGEIAHRVAGEPIRWSEWTPAEGMAIERFVLSITPDDPVAENPRWARHNAPPDLRPRATIMAIASADPCDETPVRAIGPVEVRRNAEWSAATEALIEAPEWPGHARIVGAHYPENDADLETLTSRPVRLAPEQATRTAGHDASGALRFEGPDEDRLAKLADYLEGAGWLDDALAMQRRCAALRPWDLQALEDLALAHKGLGHREEHDALRNEIVRRGMAMLPEGFAWAANTLEWGAIENRPFLRAYFRAAAKEDRRRNHKAAKTMWTQLLEVCGRDAMGARNEVLRMAVTLGQWDETLTLIEARTDEVCPDMDFGRALALTGLEKHTDAKRAMNTAAQRHPLVGSRIMQHTRAAGTDGWESYTVKGFSEAEHYWTRYEKAWTGNNGAILRAMLSDARAASPRRHTVRRSMSVCHNREAIERNLARTREAVDEVAENGARHCDELWDLLYHLECGGRGVRVWIDGGHLGARWESTAGEHLDVRLEGEWEATVHASAPATRSPRKRLTFEQIVTVWGQIDEAGER